MGNAIKDLIKDVERLDELKSHRKERNVINHIRDRVGANFDDFIALYDDKEDQALIHRSSFQISLGRLFSHPIFGDC